MPPPAHKNLVDISRWIIINESNIIHLQPCPLPSTPATVGILCIVQNKLTLKSEVYAYFGYKHYI